jgi:VWFA-related protein
MTRRTLSLLALLVLPLAAAVPTSSAQKPTFPAQTELVTVDVVVTDKKGVPVLGLTRDDFTVSEDARPQEVVAFDAVHRPGAGEAQEPAPPPGLALRVSSNRTAPGQESASFVIVFDELHLDPTQAVRAREAVGRFLKTGLRDGDRVAVVGTAEGKRWTGRIPEAREALLSVTERLQGKRVGETVRDAMTPYEAMRIDQERDPIVTDQVMRRLISTGEIQHDVAIPGERVDPSEEAANRESWRGQTQALARQVYARNAMLAEQTLGIVERALEALAEARGRKSLVLVSAGLVQDAHLRGFRNVVTKARLANTAIYFLDARGLVAANVGLQADVQQPADIIDRSTGSWLTETGEASDGSAGLARDTGGFVLENRNDLGAGLERIGEEARSYYLLGYAPTNHARDGRFRAIAVKVAREGVVVRARRGYYAPGLEDKRAQPEGRDAAFQRALDAPFDLGELPLRTLAQHFGAAGDGKTEVLLTTEADIRGLDFEEKGGASSDTLETLLLVARRDDGEYTRFDQQFEMAFQPETRARYERTWFPITRELKLAPGPYQAKVVARDHNSGRMGSVTHDFEVPAPAGLRVSSLVLSDRLLDQGGGGSRTPEVIARRTFAPSGILHCRFEIYGAARDPKTGRPNVTAGFALRRRDGRVLAAAPESPLRPGPDGTLSRSLGAPLDGAPPGSYEVIVVVTDLVAGQVAEAREPILIQGPAVADQGRPSS